MAGRDDVDDGRVGGRARGSGRPGALGLRLVRCAAAVLVAAGGLVAATVALAPAAHAATPPVTGALRGSVTADALPTAQISGVAYDQVIAGSTVFVGGRFGKARPAGVAPGAAAEVARTNLLSYNLRSGALTDWAPVLNGQVKGLALSPDGRTLYVAGQFTRVDGQNRYRLAAFDVASGALVASFHPALDYVVNAVVTSGRTVYVGGEFSTVGAVPRARLAAFRASDGALLAWNPGADDTVTTMVRAPGGPLVIGGAFTDLGTAGATPTPAYGLGAVDLTSGAVRPWPANQQVQDYGPNSAITHLATDGRQVYGSGYVFGSPGNLEGTFATDLQGRLLWVEDCHGDTYGVYAQDSVLFAVGHAHTCATVGGFPDTDPMTYHHALAFTTDARGTLAAPTAAGYHDWSGTPAPSLTTWFPDFAVGTVTGLDQSTWTVAGNGQYLVVGGEFPRVNGVAQQGLVRFAVRSIAPDQVGPSWQGGQFPLQLSVAKDDSVVVTFAANADPDSYSLRYVVRRGGTVIGRFAATSTFWNRPTMTFVDQHAPAQKASTYTVTALDESGNQAVSSPATVTVP